MISRQGKPYLIWKKAQVDGPDRERYAPVFNRSDGIELTKRYATVVEALL